MLVFVRQIVDDLEDAANRSGAEEAALDLDAAQVGRDGHPIERFGDLIGTETGLQSGEGDGVGHVLDLGLGGEQGVVLDLFDAATVPTLGAAVAVIGVFGTAVFAVELVEVLFVQELAGGHAGGPRFDALNVRSAVFVHDLVGVAAALGEVVVAGDAGHVLGVDLHDHHTLTAEASQVGQAAEVVAGRAGIVAIGVAEVAIHEGLLADMVVHRAGVAVHVVVPDLLVGQEATILGDGEGVLLHELVKLLDGVFGGVEEQVLHEVDHGGGVEPFVQHRGDAVRQGVVEGLLAVVDQTLRIVPPDLALQRVGLFEESDCVVPVARHDRILDPAVECTGLADGVVLAIDDHHEGVGGNDERTGFGKG